MTTTDWLAAIGAVLSAGAAWLALAVSLHTAYILNKERYPRVEIVAVWDLPRNFPQASKGPELPATAGPGEPVFQCEITNVGKTGVKIKEARVWIDAPPGNPLPLRLPEGEQPRKLDPGDSQTWSAGPFDYRDRGGWPDYWTHGLALDAAGNTYTARNPVFPGYSGPIRPNT